MMQEAQSSDPWWNLQDQAASGGVDGTQSALLIETIDNVTPLDAQIGVTPKKTVPDMLHDVMFGQVEPTEAEIKMAGGDASAVPPMQTYAILDAAKVTNLPELLEDSGLEHRCLFKGAAYNDLKNVAPWIVRLEDGNTFTRNLFTSSDAHWHLWDKSIMGGGAMFCRSDLSLEMLQKHFRRFTQARNRVGATVHLAFWSPQFLAAARRIALLQREDIIMDMISIGYLITIYQSGSATPRYIDFCKMSVVSTVSD